MQPSSQASSSSQPETTSVPDDARLKLRKSRTIPFGYRVHPEDPTYLVAIPVELEALRRCRIYYKEGHTMADIRRWLIKATGREITYMGLKKAILNRKDF